MIAVKRFLNIFYTVHFKVLFVVLLMIFSWVMNSEFTELLSIYKQDRAALINVFIQWENFDYENSYFIKDSAETAIEDVLEYTLVYNRKALDLYTQYDNIATEEYNELISRLKSLRHFRYAVVNHKTDIIVSNIPELNARGPEANVRRYFGDEKNLLIVRDAKSPIFENGTMVDYVEFVSEQAQKYPDDFDLYISFGDTMDFAGSSEEFSQKHNQVLLMVKSVFKNIIIYLIILFTLFVALISVAGQRELGGKTYLSLMDKLPNDIKIILYIIVYISLSALYENSLYMALQITNKADFWFNYSADFYLARSNVSMVIMITIITVFACTLKRHIRCGTLISNTYIYKAVKNYKNKEPLK